MYGRAAQENLYVSTKLQLTHIVPKVLFEKYLKLPKTSKETVLLWQINSCLYPKKCSFCPFDLNLVTE